MKKGIPFLIIATLIFSGAGCEKIEAPLVPLAVKYAGKVSTQGHDRATGKDKYRRRDYELYKTP